MLAISAAITGGSNGWPGYAVAYPKPALLFLMTSLTGINKIELQLDNHIDDTRHEDSFKGLINLDDLSVLVQIGRHKIYDMVYNLLKLLLFLPVATFFPKSAFH